MNGWYPRHDEATVVRIDKYYQNRRNEFGLPRVSAASASTFGQDGQTVCCFDGIDQGTVLLSSHLGECTSNLIALRELQSNVCLMVRNRLLCLVARPEASTASQGRKGVHSPCWQVSKATTVNPSWTYLFSRSVCKVARCFRSQSSSQIVLLTAGQTESQV